MRFFASVSAKKKNYSSMLGSRKGAMKKINGKEA
jgi:hypothetical protein